jgi:hypothetical protein
LRKMACAKWLAKNGLAPAFTRHAKSPIGVMRAASAEPQLAAAGCSNSDTWRRSEDAGVAKWQTQRT